jgi:hypothetical protein
MAKRRRSTTDAVEILHRRFFEGKPEMIAGLEEARLNDCHAAAHRGCARLSCGSRPGASRAGSSGPQRRGGARPQARATRLETRGEEGGGVAGDDTIVRESASGL